MYWSRWDEERSLTRLGIPERLSELFGYVGPAPLLDFRGYPLTVGDRVVVYGTVTELDTEGTPVAATFEVVDRKTTAEESPVFHAHGKRAELVAAD